MTRASFFLLSGILLSGCFLRSNPDPPAWVLSPQEMYSHTEYLVGMGEGRSRDQAEKRAYAAVARIFSAHVQAQSSDEETYLLKEHGGQESTQRSLQIDFMTRVTTNKVLENVQILESWLREKDRQYFVLAGLHRAQAEQMLLARLQAIDQSIREKVQQGRSSTAKIHRIQGYKQGMALLSRRPQVNSDLRVVRTSGEGLPPPFSLNVIQREFLEFVASHVTISVSMQGESHQELERAIWEALKKEGLLAGAKDPISGTSEHSSDISITGFGRLWPVDIPDPLFRYVRWCGDIEIRERDSQRLMGMISRSGREGHITEREARIRASRAMQQEMAKEVAQILTESVFQENGEPLPPNPSPKSCPQ